MAFITVEELSAWLHQDLTSMSGDALQACELASDAVADHLRQTVSSTTATKSYTGVWDTAFVLPERPAGIVTAVTIDGDTVTDWTQVGQILHRESGWGGPEVVVTVAYTFGWVTIPNTIKTVTLRVAARMFRNPMGRVTEGGDGYTMTLDSTIGPRILTGDEQAALNRFRPRVGMI